MSWVIYTGGVLIGLVVAIATVRVILSTVRRRPQTGGVDSGDIFRKAQAEAVPRLGGVALMIAFLVGSLMLLAFPRSGTDQSVLQWTFIVANLLMFCVGFADDLKPLSAPLKFGLQIMVALLAYHFGIRLDVLSAPFSDGYIELGSYSLPLTVFWLILIPNILNLVDGMDGLAGGIGLFLCLTIGALALIMGHGDVVALSAVMCGAIFGFLIFNLPPAKIYLGDGGSHLLGFYIASSSLLAASKSSVAAALVVVLLALAFPILDTLVSVARRVLTGVPFWKPDAGHLHHRLLSLGISKQSILLVLYGAFFTISLAALGAFLIGGYAFLVVAMLCGMLALRLFYTVGYLNSWEQVVNLFRKRLRSRRHVQFASALATVLTHQLDRSASGEEFWQEFDQLVGRAGIRPAPEGNLNSANRPSEVVANDTEQEVEVPLIGGGTWKIRANGDGRSEATEWIHVARCFLPAASQAVARWPEAKRLAMQRGFAFPSASPSPAVTGQEVGEVVQLT